MTRTYSRDQWVRIHSRRMAGLYNVYQCKANPEVWDRLDKAIKGVVTVITEIGDLKESEGDWSNPCISCPNKACVDPCPALNDFLDNQGEGSP